MCISFTNMLDFSDVCEKLGIPCPVKPWKPDLDTEIDWLDFNAKTVKKEDGSECLVINW